jgi:transposase-like protein
VTEQELARGAARRLAILRHAREVTGNVSMTCRYFGITRQAYYTWLRRYEEHGLDRSNISSTSSRVICRRVISRSLGPETIIPIINKPLR